MNNNNLLRKYNLVVPSFSILQISNKNHFIKHYQFKFSLHGYQVIKYFKSSYSQIVFIL